MSVTMTPPGVGRGHEQSDEHHDHQNADQQGFHLVLLTEKIRRRETIRQFTWISQGGTLEIGEGRRQRLPARTRQARALLTTQRIASAAAHDGAGRRVQWTWEIGGRS